MKNVTFLKQLDELEALARRVVAYSDMKYGLGWNYIDDNSKLGGYVSEGRGHKSATVFGVGVSFFDPVRFEITRNKVKVLDTLIKDSGALLDELEAKHASEDERATAEIKRLRIANLEEELESLRGDSI